jgi:Asp-tRNA(Asn)/Glu-tRNA(Gln) amidotransferase A subunit family amidase
VRTTIAELGCGFRAGRQHPRAEVETCLEQIDRHDPHLRAWVLVDRQAALDQAERLAEELRRGHDRGPLHGVPIGIKDIIDVAGWPTRAGSTVLAGHPAVADAPVVCRLRQAGAILLGKTVTTEFASFDPSPTHNPWHPDRTPGGSSSGSAAAVASGMCPAALGTQTGGSITRPASYCGVAGIKPTWGRVSAQGVFPLSFHLDHVGAIANDVYGLAVLLQTMAGAEPFDPSSSDHPVDDYLAPLAHPEPPRHALGGSIFAESETWAEFLALLQRRAMRVPTIELPGGFGAVLEFHRLIMAAEAAAVHRETFPARRADYGPCLASLLDEGLGHSARDLAVALQHQGTFRAAMHRTLVQADVDALIVAATPAAATGIETTGNPRFNSPWSYCGLPTVSIPFGLDRDGLPLAIQLVGQPWQEARLLAAAAWWEQWLAFDSIPPLS